jgi:hypothetical protein
MPKMLDAALDYAHKGIPVFPCDPRTKRPLTPNGFKDATVDEKQIRLWWGKQYPSAMIGMPTGAASDKVVLDGDVDPGKGIDGPQELAQLVAKNSPLPKTPTSVTPRTGMHYFFARPESPVIKNSKGKLGRGLDIRGEGGYVILPPSVRSDGTPYRWANGADFSSCAQLPAWLIKILVTSPRERTWAKNALEKECAAVAAAKPGERNDILNKAAFNLFQIVAGGALDGDLVRDELYSAAVLCGLVDDDGEGQVWATIESGASAGRQQPRYRAGNGTHAALVPATPTQKSPPPPPPPPLGGTPSGSATPGPAPAPSPTPALPIIRLIDGHLPRIVDQSEDALLAAKKHIYQRGGRVVRPARQKLTAANNRTTFAWELIEMTGVHLRETLTKIARYEQMDFRLGDYMHKDCPEEIAQTYLARRGDWRLPLLLGVVNSPFLRADGTICERPGYDPDSALLFIPGGQGFPAMPQNPTLEQAREALKYLDDALLSEFPFVAKIDHSVALSAILTALDRRSIATAPLHALSSPIAGTGKSLLVDLISILLNGRPAPVIAQGKNEEELDKRLAAALLCSDQIISIDNCDRELTSNFLCQALTQQVLKIRLLGYSQQVEVPVSSMFFATGNNLVISDDLVRRALLCGLDARVAQPELRTFKSNVFEEARSQRGKLVCAVLTILRAWHMPGAAAPIGVAPLGSFEDWSFRVRSPLVWLDQTDPCESMKTVRENDPARAALSAILEQWTQKLQIGTVYRVQDIITRAMTDIDFFGALMAVAASRQSNTISNDRLGRYLVKNNGKIVERSIGQKRLKLEKQGTTAGYPLWKVIEV